MQNARTDFHRDSVTDSTIPFGESVCRFAASAMPPSLVYNPKITPPIYL